MREAIAVRRVERELSIRGARPRTQKSYLGYIQRYFVYCREVQQAPDLAETVRNHLLYLREDRLLSDSTLNVAYTATRLLFEVGYHQTWKEEKIPRCKKVSVRGTTPSTRPPSPPGSTQGGDPWQEIRIAADIFGGALRFGVGRWRAGRFQIFLKSNFAGARILR